MNKSNATILLIAIVISGCATSNITYSPPAGYTVDNAKASANPFDTVWDKLVKNLASDFFVINNIDKNSRLINISFTSQKPSDFVDCGRTARSFTNARGTQNYNYDTADSATFSMANPQGAVFNVRRGTRLEGRANIYVAPEGTGTQVSVNAKYVVTVAISAFNMEGRPAGNENITFDFSTKEGFTGNSDAQGNRVSCHTRGIIERKILNFVD